MTIFINIQSNQEREDGSFELIRAIKSDHYCVGLDMVSLLLIEEACLALAEVLNNE